MSQPFSVEAATLHRAAKDVRSTRQQVDAKLKDLSGEVDNLRAGWQGSAAGGFQQLMVRWNEDVRKLLGAMDSIADLLDKSGTTHAANDQEQQEAFGRIHSALNP